MNDTAQVTSQPADSPVGAGIAVRRVEDTLDLLRSEAHLFRRRVPRRSYLYRSGQPFDSLYLVQGGHFRISVLNTDGREKVTGFRIAGDFLGLDALGLDTHPSDAFALDVAYVYVIPVASLEALCARVPRLQTTIAHALASELRTEARWQLSMSAARADRRVARFLLDVAEQQQHLGFSRTDLALKMTRADIGNFLGLTLETVTRVLTRFAHAGLLDVTWRAVHIRDLDGLTRHAIAAR